MGHIYTDIEVENPRNGRRCQVKAMVDTGATFLTLPPSVAAELELATIDERRVILSDGSSRQAPYAGPIMMRVGSRRCGGGAIILSGDPLLGVVPLEDMDLVVDPQRRKLAPHPDAQEGPRAFHCGNRYDSDSL